MLGDRRVGGDRGRRARRVAARGRAGVGTGPAGRGGADPRRPHRRPAARRAGRPRRSRCPPRSATALDDVSAHRVRLSRAAGSDARDRQCGSGDQHAQDNAWTTNTRRCGYAANVDRLTAAAQLAIAGRVLRVGAGPGTAVPGRHPQGDAAAPLHRRTAADRHSITTGSGERRLFVVFVVVQVRVRVLVEPTDDAVAGDPAVNGPSPSVSSNAVQVERVARPRRPRRYRRAAPAPARPARRANRRRDCSSSSTASLTDSTGSSGTLLVGHRLACGRVAALSSAATLGTR